MIHETGELGPGRSTQWRGQFTDIVAMCCVLARFVRYHY